MAKILVPVDFSECSFAALKYAVSLARGADRQLIILHAAMPSSAILPDPSPESDRQWRELLYQVKGLAAEEPVFMYETRCVTGTPVSCIVAAADEGDVELIVMGTTGRTGLKRALLGSVAEEVVRRASCPVLCLKVPEGHRDHASSDAIWHTWPANARTTAPQEGSETTALNRVDDNPAMSLVSRAIMARASDVHLDPAGAEYSVRFRIDGVMHIYCLLSQELGHSLATQLKVCSHLNIADPFHNQEGRIELPPELHDFDVRITVVRTVDGEAISLRILNRRHLVRPLEQLGFSPSAQERVDRILKRGEGLILVTGPTGSGKTTTLYSMLHVLNNGTQNIVSIEDPVEYRIPAFRQLQVDLKHGTTMISGLKTMLRLDPDIVLVGEIRDVEAAETAMRAASSGKYVFSSLHTRDVASTVTALRDLHIDNRSLAGNLVGIISQRLIRRLCVECCRTSETTTDEAKMFEDSGLEAPETLAHPVGCPRCRGTGYYDRIGIFEVVIPDEELVRAIEEGRPELEIREAIRASGVTDLKTEALRNAASRVTSLEECQTVLSISADSSSVAVSCPI